MNNCNKILQPTTETFYDLWERRNETSLSNNHATDHVSNARYDNPSNAAAREFFQPITTSGTTGTGISFIDTALSMRDDDSILQQPSKPIIIDICGDTATGKTSTVVTLAARYLFATRQCRPNIIDAVQNMNDIIVMIEQEKRSSDEIHDEKSLVLLPQVILFDVNRNVTNCARRVYDILQSMIREEYLEMKRDKENRCIDVDTSNDDDDNINDTLLQNETMGCLQRLHIARVDDFPQWVLLLETLRHEMSFQQKQQRCINQPFTTLLLWDDFLDEVLMTTPSYSFHNHLIDHNNTTYHRSIRSEMTAIRMDVIRQFERLLQECPNPTILVTTSSTTAIAGSNQTHPKTHQKRVIGKEWNRFVTHSIHLDQCREHPKVTNTNSSIDRRIPHHHDASSQFSNPPYLGTAIITKNDHHGLSGSSSSSGHIAQQEQRQQHTMSFSISTEGIVS